ncbi:MAG: hypothetical protein AABX84_00160, partial [Nanoarchaeota archaeon]
MVENSQYFENNLGSLHTKLRDLEEKYRILKDRTLLIGQNLIDMKENSDKKMLETKKDIQVIKENMQRLVSFIETASEEFSKFAKKEDLEILYKQAKMFQPLDFVRKKDLEKLKKAKKLFKIIKMGVLDQITQMRNQGLSDSDIVSQLQEDGFHPKTINDALAQADIKSAVDNGMEEMEPTTNQYNEEENAPSPMGERISPKSREYQDDIYTPQPAQSEYSSGNYLSQSGNHSSGMQEIYPQGQEQGSYAASDTDTMVEIAQQVFSEKIRKKSIDKESEKEV